MRTTLFAVLATTTFLSPVSAAEIDVVSKIDAVTVYPQGAEITRVAEVEIAAGDHTLVLDDLPGDIDAQSIRVEGVSAAAVEIGSVDSKIVNITNGEEFAGRRRQLETEIQALRDKVAAFDQVAQSVEYQRRLIQDFVQRPFVVQKPSDKDMRIDSAELGNLFDLVAGRLQALDKRALDARIATRKVNKQIGDLEKKLNELAPKKTVKAIVTVNLSGKAATSGTFRVKYRIRNAGWRPFYDARLSVPETQALPSLSLVRRAEIVQRTTESWNDVALTLSTARPVGATAAPDLPAFQLSFAQNELWQSKRDNGRLSSDEAASPAAEAKGFLDKLVKEEDVVPAEQRQTEVSIAGFQALYAIAGRVSVDNQGTAKKVRIATETISARLSAHMVPVLDPNAYLTAKFTVNGVTPLLPGRVLLFRDNVYMGEGALPLLAPGEDHALGFGVDDRIKVKRSEVRSQTSETGLISTEVVKENSWVIEVENLHQRTMPVQIFDRMPFATHEDITVKLLPGTPPSERDVEHKRGVLAWSYDLAAGAEKAINFGYRVTSPKGKQVLLGMR